MPASPLRADHGGALGNAPQRLTQVVRAAHERDGERPLVDVVLLVRRGQHLALVDVVDAQHLEHLGLGEMPDPGLGHYRDAHGRFDALDQSRVAHPGHAAVAADVGGHPLEGHDRGSAGILGHDRLFGRDHVHDHATPQLGGQAPLDRQVPLRCAPVCSGRAAAVFSDFAGPSL